MINSFEQVNVFESIKQNKNLKAFPSHPISKFPGLSSWPFQQIKLSIYCGLLNTCHRLLHLLEPEKYVN